MEETRSEPWFWRSAEEFGRLRLENGSHQGPDEGVCLMEAVAWLAREPHSDEPKCVCPVLGAFGRDLNDRLDVERRGRLKPLIPALVGTASDGQAEARGFMAMDWIVRTYTPAWLRLARLDTDAEGLESLPEIVNMETLDAARGRLGAVRRSDGVAAWAATRAAAWAAAWDAAGDAAWAATRAAAGAAAWDAAGAAAWAAARAAAVDATRAAAGAAAGAAGAAAWAAAWDAAWAAAWDAAGAAAWAVARAAAGDAARDAAGAAAGAALEPTKRALQDSAVLLFRRMVERGSGSCARTPWATEAVEAW